MDKTDLKIPAIIGALTIAAIAMLSWPQAAASESDGAVSAPQKIEAVYASGSAYPVLIEGSEAEIPAELLNQLSRAASK